jgi:uncharacterized protein with PIN domain
MKEKPECPRCHVTMRFFSVEVVSGPDKKGYALRVYECPKCDRATAEEIIKPADGHNEAA